MSMLEQLLMGQLGPQAGPEHEALIRALIEKQMTQGLGVGPGDQIGFSGPVAGFAGPIRESDVPFAASPDIAMGQTQLPTGRNLAEVVGMAPSFQGLPPGIREALMSELTGLQGSSDSKLGEQMALAKYRHDLGAEDRALARGGQAEARADRAASSQERLALQKEMLEFNKQTRRMPTTPYKDAITQLEEMASGGATLEEMENAVRGMGYDVVGTRRGRGYLGLPIGRPEIPVPGLGPRPGEGSAPGPSALTPPGSQAPRIVVSKVGPDGRLQRASLPANQLGEAMKQGWNLAQ